VHHVGILYGQFMMHGQRNIKLFRYKERNGSTEEGKIEGRIKVSQTNNTIPS